MGPANLVASRKKRVEKADEPISQKVCMLQLYNPFGAFAGTLIEINRRHSPCRSRASSIEAALVQHILHTDQRRYQFLTDHARRRGHAYECTNGLVTRHETACLEKNVVAKLSLLLCPAVSNLHDRVKERAQSEIRRQFACLQ